MIDQADFKPYKLETLFTIHTGGDLVYSNLSKGEFIVTGNGKRNHSVINRSEDLRESEQRTLFNCNKTLSLANYGVLYSTVQLEDFFIGKRVKALQLALENYGSEYIRYENKHLLHFLAALINLESYRFNYGRIGSTKRVGDLVINLPSIQRLDGSFITKSIQYKNINKKKRIGYEIKETLSYIPNFEKIEQLMINFEKDNRSQMTAIPNYMRDANFNRICWYMDNIDQSLFESEYMPKVGDGLPLTDTTTWQFFKLDDLFSASSSKSYNKNEVNLIIGDVNAVKYITRKSTDNGFVAYVSAEDLQVEGENALTIGAESALCFYQQDRFVCGNNITVLRGKVLTKYTGVFFATLINTYAKDKYSYGRGYSLSKVKETYIPLPICKDEQGMPQIDKDLNYHAEGYVPDIAFIENYIKGLPFSNALT